MSPSTGPATAIPAGPVYRVGYGSDPWSWVPWEYGPFRGRWDDPEDVYRVLYSGSSKLACLLEVLADFRPDLAVLAELEEIEWDPLDGTYPTAPPGEVSQSWVQNRAVGTAGLAGTYIDVGAKETLAWLRANPRVAARAVYYGIHDVDGAAVRDTAPRGFTQEISNLLYGSRFEEAGRVPDGVRFESRHGNDLVLWGLFERSEDHTAGDLEHSRLLLKRSATPLAADDPDLNEALNIHGLQLA